MSGNKGDQAIAAMERTLRTAGGKTSVVITLEEQQKYVDDLLEKDRQKKEKQRELSRNSDSVRIVSFYNPQRYAEQSTYLKAKAAGNKIEKPFKQKKVKTEKEKKVKPFTVRQAVLQYKQKLLLVAELKKEGKQFVPADIAGVILSNNRVEVPIQEYITFYKKPLMELLTLPKDSNVEEYRF
jgi:hypothetical protein